MSCTFCKVNIVSSYGGSPVNSVSNIGGLPVFLYIAVIIHINIKVINKYKGLLSEFILMPLLCICDGVVGWLPTLSRRHLKFSMIFLVAVALLTTMQSGTGVYHIYIVLQYTGSPPIMVVFCSILIAIVLQYRVTQVCIILQYCYSYSNIIQRDTNIYIFKVSF